MNTHTIHPCRCYYKIKYIQNFCVTSPNLIQKLQTTRISRQGLLKAFSYILNFYFLTFQKSVDWSFFKIQYFYICHTNLGKSAKEMYILDFRFIYQITMSSTANYNDFISWTLSNDQSISYVFIFTQNQNLFWIHRIRDKSQKIF